VNEVYKKYRENWRENVDRMRCEKIPKRKGTVIQVEE
jgi:hypothetical protein